jgi:hypothetical protein
MNNATCTSNGVPIECPEFITNMGQYFGMLGVIFTVTIFLTVIFLAIIPGWKIFKKAGKPGWAVLVPVYNMVVMLEIVKKPLWWIFLMFIPVVNFVVMILVIIELAKAFGKSTGFAVGLILLGPVFYSILGYGKSTYLWGDVAPVAPVAPEPMVTPTV